MLRRCVATLLSFKGSSLEVRVLPHAGYTVTALTSAAENNQTVCLQTSRHAPHSMRGVAANMEELVCGTVRLGPARALLRR
jgi:hypothetical protein